MYSNYFEKLMPKQEEEEENKKKSKTKGKKGKHQKRKPRHHQHYDINDLNIYQSQLIQSLISSQSHSVAPPAPLPLDLYSSQIPISTTAGRSMTTATSKPPKSKTTTKPKVKKSKIPTPSGLVSTKVSQLTNTGTKPLVINKEVKLPLPKPPPTEDNLIKAVIKEGTGKLVKPKNNKVPQTILKEEAQRKKMRLESKLLKS